MKRVACMLFVVLVVTMTGSAQLESHDRRWSPFPEECVNCKRTYIRFVHILDGKLEITNCAMPPDDHGIHHLTEITVTSEDPREIESFTLSWWLYESQNLDQSVKSGCVDVHDLVHREYGEGIWHGNLDLKIEPFDPSATYGIEFQVTGVVLRDRPSPK